MKVQTDVKAGLTLSLFVTGIHLFVHPIRLGLTL